MAINKVEYAGNTLIDLTNDTVTPETLAEGVTAHDKSGNIIIGTMSASEDLNTVLTEQENLIATLQAVLIGKASGGGGDNVAKSIVDKSIENYIDGDVTAIGAYSFYGCTKLASVNAPSATSVGTYAFSGCTALASVNLTGAKSIGAYAFEGCTPLTSFNGASVTSIGTYAFTGCSSLAEISLPLATSVAGYAFNGTSFKHLALPSLKSMTSNAFRGTKCESVYMPLVTNIGNNSFRGQGYLKSATFPSVTSTNSEAMRNCSALTYVDLPSLTSFGTYTFCDCVKLETLILRYTGKVVALGNINILTNTAIANGTGYVYVPKSLQASYAQATNWVNYSAQIRAIEDYTVDGTLTGELDTSKI